MYQDALIYLLTSVSGTFIAENDNDKNSNLVRVILDPGT